MSSLLKKYSTNPLTGNMGTDFTDEKRLQHGWSSMSVVNELPPVIKMHWHHRSDGSRFSCMDIEFDNVHPNYKTKPEEGHTVKVHQVSSSCHDRVIFEGMENYTFDTFTDAKGVKCLMVVLNPPGVVNE